MNQKKHLKLLIASCLAMSITTSLFTTMQVKEKIQTINAAQADIDRIRIEWGPSWKADGLIKHNGSYAYCMQFGLASPTGEIYKQTITGFENNAKVQSILYHGQGTNASKLQEKYGISNHDAANATQWALHAIATEIGFPNADPYPVNKFINDAPKNQVGSYGKELLQLALAENIPNIQINVSPSATKSVYDAKLNMLVSDQFYTANVEGSKITFSNLPQDVFVVNEQGERISEASSGQKFKLATSNLRMNATLNNINVQSHVKETAPIFYSFPGKQTIVQASSIDPLKEVSISTKFTPAVGDVEFIKMNATKNEALPGVAFELLNKENEVIQTAKSNAEGKVLFKDVLSGEYTVKEKPVVGDGIIDEELTFDVIVLPGKTVDLSGTKVVNNKENEIKFSKLDNENNKPVDGAVVTLLDASGKVIFKGDGNSTITGISAGNYKLKEIMAPTRFLMNEQETDVNITEDGKVSVGIIHDETRDITVTKKDGHNGKKLKDAEFELQTLDDKTVEMLDKDNNLVPATGKTDENGEVRFRGLPVGDYKVVEKTAPTGYTINSDLSVKADEKMDTKYDFVDYRIPKTPETPTIPVYDFLPKTGAEIGGIALEPILVGGSGIGAVLVALARRFKK